MSKAATGKKRTSSVLNKILAVSVVTMMVVCCFVFMKSGDSEALGPQSGSCGVNLQWEIDTSTGALTITGSGAMTNYNIDSVRWGGYTIKSVSLPSGLTTIGDYAFYNCYGLTSVGIPGTVTSIGQYSFCLCSGLTEITIPNSVTTLGPFSFCNCAGLTTVSIPDSVTTMNNYVFMFCTGLTSVSIGSGVNSIMYQVFDCCYNLQSFTVSNDNANYSSDNGVLFNKTKSTLVRYPIGKTDSSYSIPTSVNYIGGYAFESCANLSSVTIPTSVTSMGDGVFKNSGITSINIPDSVTAIGERSFYGCPNLGSVSIGSTLSSIGPLSLADCPNLQNLTVNSSNANYSSVDNVLFNKAMTRLIVYSAKKTDSSYSIPSGVTTIDYYAFKNTLNLTSVTIPEGVTSINMSTFEKSGITSITIPNSVTTIGEYAFQYCSNLGSITIPNSVTTIGDRAFSYCSNLGSITIPNSVTTIGDYAFEHCSRLSTVTLPNGLVMLDSGVFMNTGITSINIPDSVSTIQDHVFDGCQYLRNVSIGSGVMGINTSAFINCPRLESFTVSNDNPTYASENGVLLDKFKTMLIKYPSGKTNTSYTVPSTVTTIFYGAFKGCYNLTTVTISENVTDIKSDSFSLCKNLELFIVSNENGSYCAIDGVLFNDNKNELVKYPAGKEDRSYTVPTTVTSIKAYAFDECRKLTTVTLPDNLTAIGERAFQGCSGLKSMRIPEKVNTIGNSPFSGCSNLESFSVSGSNQSFCTIDGVLYNKTKTVLIWCPTKWEGILMIPYGVNAENIWENIRLCEGIKGFSLEDNQSFQVKDRMLYRETELNYLFNAVKYVSGDGSESFTLNTIVVAQDNPFYFSNNLKEITVNKSDPVFASNDGCLYDRSMTQLISCPSGKRSIELPSTVRITNAYSMNGDNLEDVVFSSGSRTVVSKNSFYNCNSLKKIVIEEGADVVFENDSICFDDDEEHTIYIVAPDEFKLDTSCYRSNIKIVYGEPPGESNLTIFLVVGGVVGAIVFVGAAVLLIRHFKSAKGGIE